MKIIKYLGVSFLIILSSSAIGKTCGPQWQWLSPSPDGLNKNAVAHHGDRTIIVGDGGSMYHSSDSGTTWFTATNNATEDLHDITYGSKYITVGKNGFAMTSDDGISWVHQATNTQNKLNAVSESVAVGDLGTILKIGNSGETWNTVSAGIFQNLNGVVDTGSLVIVVGNNGTIWSAQSANLDSWTDISPTDANNINLVDVAYNGSAFVAIANRYAFYSEDDGVSWNKVDLNLQAGGGAFKTIAWNATNGEFLVGGMDGVIARSADGKTWTSEGDFASLTDLNNISWDGSQYFGVGDYGNIVVSASGNKGDWQKNSIDLFKQSYRDIIWNEARSEFIAVGYEGSVLISPDGFVWNEKTNINDENWNAIIWDGSQYVATGFYKLKSVHTSVDGKAWSHFTGGHDFTSIAVGDVVGTKTYVTTSYSFLYNSTDLEAWNQTVVTGGISSQHVIFANDMFVIVGSYAAKARIAVSMNGSNWNVASTPATANGLMRIAWSGNEFVAVGVNTILRSEDGANWAPYGDNKINARDVMWSGDEFLLVDYAGTIYSSTDGRNWTVLNIVKGAPRGYRLALGNDKLITHNGGKQFAITSCITGNVSPTVDAGVDQTVNEETTVTLTGLGSDNDGTIDSYSWTQTGGLNISLTSVDSATTTFTSPTITSDQTLTFTLTVTDDAGASRSDSVDILVKPINISPVAVAGDDRSATVASLVILNGANSYDDDGTIATYLWEQVGESNIGISQAHTSNAQFTAPIVSAITQLTFKLTVTDNEGASDSDVIIITVSPVNQNPSNLTPTASAGDDQTVMDSINVTLDGSASSDGDGSITTYLWQQVGGSDINLVGASAAIATFTAPTVSNSTQYTFRLTVTDNEGATHADEVVITVNPNTTSGTSDKGVTNAEESTSESTSGLALDPLLLFGIILLTFVTRNIRSLSKTH